VKSQNVRAFDIVALGPFLVWVGSRREIGDFERFLLVAAGLGTIAYNLRNYGRTAALAGETPLLIGEEVNA